MTSHRLIRCARERLLERAAAAHPAVSPPHPDRRATPHWRQAAPAADLSVAWLTRLPEGSVLGWCLEVEEGANGVLTHLSAAPVAGPATRLPRSVLRVVLRLWVERELDELARAAEHCPTRTT